MINRLWILLYLLLISYAGEAQELDQQTEDSSTLIDERLANQYLNAVNTKIDVLEKKLDRYMNKTLEKSERHYLAIIRKITRRDSLKAKAIAEFIELDYTQPGRLEQEKFVEPYLPAFDTMKTSIKFLQENSEVLSRRGELGKVKETIGKIKVVGEKLGKAEEVKNFLGERKQLLKNQLEGFGFNREIKKLNKQAYYYTEQLNEYKSLLKDHTKAERKVIELISKTKLFQNFMRKNSMLASLFRLPGDPNDPANVANLMGLQTRAQVSNIIQQQIGTNGQSQLQQNVQDAQLQLQQLKDKISRWGSGSSEEAMPENFKPNGQKTKSILKRLEYGTNIQTQKASNFFPVTSDIGLSVGYKLNDKSIVGVGASYKIGLGKAWKNMNITNEGIGLRSFIDLKLKGGIWLSGGYEQNYKRAFNRIDELRNQSGWQQGGLAGVSKVVSLKTKFFKKTKLQLLWDFLSYQQVPRTQPIVFRIGYNVK